MKLFQITTMMALVFGWAATSIAQTPNPKVEKIMEKVDDCNYEVVLGLAEIVSVEKIVDAADSPLAYDEYEVKFVFHRMEGNELLPSLAEAPLPFYLKYKSYDLRVGPEYIKSYQVRKGLKFSMKMLQNRDGTCAQKYVYDSRGIPNDLFEARPNLLEFEKDYYIEAAREKEGAIATDEFRNTTSPDVSEPETAAPTAPVETPKTTNPVVQPPTETIPVETEEPTTTTPEATTTTEEPATTSTDDNSVEEVLTLDEERIRAELEAEIAAQLAAEEAERKKKEEEERKAEEARKKEEEERKARQRKKEQEEQARLEEEERKRQEEELRLKEEALREQMREEIEAEMREEMELKRQQEEQQRLEEERKKAEEERLRQEALAREEAMRQAKELEEERASCKYQENISGIIKVIEVKKSTDEKESVFGYTEYEVYVKFIPDNLEDFSKKERKMWDEQYLFVIDAKGKSANPSAAYIRKYNVFKGSSYKGFAQVLEDGICNQLLMFSPDLPADEEQINVE